MENLEVCGSIENEEERKETTSKSANGIILEFDEENEKICYFELCKKTK